jgi:hypothetical protein
MYRNLPYNDLRMRHMIWMTTDLFENFIAYNHISGQAAMKEQILSKYYSDKELHKFSNQSIEEGIAVMEKMPLRNAEYYLGQYYFYSQFYHINSKNNRSRDFKLQEIIDHSTLFSIIETLRYACIIQSLQKISEFKIKNHLLEATLALIKDSDFLKITPVRVYYHIYMVITEEDEEAFSLFIEDIKKNSDCFTGVDLKDLYLFAINFCVKKSNQNIQSYALIAFELYLYAIQEGYLVEHNEISRFSFTNVVTLGIKLKEFTKTEQFIKRYANLITPEYM